MIKKLLLCAAMAAPLCVNAADVYVTPEGNGTKDGTTWDNAMGMPEFISHFAFSNKAGDHSKSDMYNDETFKFATGVYNFNKTVFVYRSALNIQGGYDQATGELATTGRTVFSGKEEARNGSTFFFQTKTTVSGTDKRPVIINNIDFEDFIFKGAWGGGDENNWAEGKPSVLYVEQCADFQITNCNFNNNKSTAEGGNAMAGAITFNRANALVRNCTFTGNEGNEGGAIKMYYNISGTWVKDVYLTIDQCVFNGNKTNGSGGAVIGRNDMRISAINSTFYGNEAKTSGGAIYSNAPGNYDQILDLVSCTIAGNSAPTGPEIYTNGKGALNMANSIVVANTEANPIADLSSTEGYKFLGYNIVGPVAEGYSTSDDEPTEPAAMVMSSTDGNTNSISADNTYASVFGTNTLEANGTLCPIVAHPGMPVAELTALVESQKWPYAVDAAVDQLGQPRTDKTSVGAGAFDTTVTAIDTIAPDATEADSYWYTIQGMRLNGEPTAPGLYIHAGKKIIVR